MWATWTRKLFALTLNYRLRWFVLKSLNFTDKISASKGKCDDLVHFYVCLLQFEFVFLFLNSRSHSLQVLFFLAREPLVQLTASHGPLREMWYNLHLFGCCPLLSPVTMNIDWWEISQDSLLIGWCRDVELRWGWLSSEAGQTIISTQGCCWLSLLSRKMHEYSLC